MSLRPIPPEAVPASTVAVARAAFPCGNPFLRLRDALGPVLIDVQFAALFPSHGQPAEAPWRVAVVTLLQFAENLSDRRLLTPRRREEYAVLEAARACEKEEAFAAEYRRRTGIEVTLSVGVRVMHLRRARYVGLAKTHLQHVLTAATMNLSRLGAWLADKLNCDWGWPVRARQPLTQEPPSHT